MLFCLDIPDGSAGLRIQLLLAFGKPISQFDFLGLQCRQTLRQSVSLLSGLSMYTAGLRFDDSLFSFYHATVVIFDGFEQCLFGLRDRL